MIDWLINSDKVVKHQEELATHLVKNKPSGFENPFLQTKHPFISLYTKQFYPKKPLH